MNKNFPITVPQNNPKAGYLAHRKEIDSVIQRVLESGWYILGKAVSQFENEFKAYLGTSHAIGVASGTDALELSLRVCGIGAGDTVITVSHTAVATAAAIERTGASLAFVDIDPETYTLDPWSLKALLKKSRQKLKAVIPVHLYGYPVDMKPILSLAKQYGLLVIEDCAQAHGAELLNRKIGTYGDLGAFSFYPTKNLGAMGDGGMVVTKNSALAQKVRELREYGWKKRYISSSSGTNSRLDEIQAAILRVKLKYLDLDNRKRRRIAQFYTKTLWNVKLPVTSRANRHVFHQYVIRTPHRDALKLQLAQKGIATLIHYPKPIHQQPAYRKQAFQPVSLRVTESICKEVLSLPMFPQLTQPQIQHVCAAIVQFCPTGR